MPTIYQRFQTPFPPTDTFSTQTVERLLRFLTALDQDVTIEVRPKPADRPKARLSIAEPA